MYKTYVYLVEYYWNYKKKYIYTHSQARHVRNIFICMKLAFYTIQLTEEYTQ